MKGMTGTTEEDMMGVVPEPSTLLQEKEVCQKAKANKRSRKEKSTKNLLSMRDKGLLFFLIWFINSIHDTAYQK